METNEVKQRKQKLQYEIRQSHYTTGKQPLIIGVTGYAKSGKDTAVNVFKEELGNIATSFAFADPIREIGKVFGFTQEQLTDQSLKEVVDEFWGITPRTFMQQVGTELFRNNFRDTVWIDVAHKKINELKKRTSIRVIFITDVRFPNEVEFIKAIGGQIWKVNRLSQSTETQMYQHASEQYITSIKPDATVVNDSTTVEAYREYCKEWLHNQLL